MLLSVSFIQKQQIGLKTSQLPAAVLMFAKLFYLEIL